MIWLSTILGWTVSKDTRLSGDTLLCETGDCITGRVSEEQVHTSTCPLSYFVTKQMLRKLRIKPDQSI